MLLRDFGYQELWWRSIHQPELPHEGDKEVGWACLPEEGVVQELGGGGALRGVPHQHLVEEAMQSRRDLKTRP